MQGLWFQDAVIYCLDVDTFQDSDGDGVGDFNGLIERLDHIVALGANCIWLLPFFPSPDRDNGYDVLDYYSVDPRLGTLGDFVEFMHKAREHGVRVIIDLVVNHTSDQHPWFQEARKDKDSHYRDYYIWSKKKPKDVSIEVVFPGEQEDVWTYDSAAREYYFHHFHDHQPDLNMSNPRVREEIRRVMGFWLELGVSGFRVDAAPFLVNEEDAAEALREFREFLSWRRGDAILLAEANVPPNEMLNYFADGTQVHMMFNFWVNQRLMLSLARQDSTPLATALEEIPKPPPSCQFANFIRNHDELDLGRLSDAERNEVYRVFAPEKRMRIYNRGIRRRLPPMVGGDVRRLKMAYSLLFSLPGAAVLRYGEEIGMGEDLSLAGRESVRTGMQWTDDPNGGFSTAPAKSLLRPVISRGKFGYPKVNVREQSADPDSLLSAVQHFIRARKQCPELGQGGCRALDGASSELFVHRCDGPDGAIVAVHNLSDRPHRWKPPATPGDVLVDLLATPVHRAQVSDKPIQIPPYGYRWFRVSPK